MWQFVEAVEGLADACRALDIPITGGNVSLYNETDGHAIYPTPIIGVVGVLDDSSKVLARSFRNTGHDLVLLGKPAGELGGSEYLKVIHGLVKGSPPRLDLDRERSLIALLGRAATSGLLCSAHDCSDGGLAVTLAESSFDTGGIGLEVDLPLVGSDIATLFGESASIVVVSTRRENRTTLLEMAAAGHVPARVIGHTGGSRLRIHVDGRTAIDCAVAEAEQVWGVAIERYFAGRAA
jgi:phosphoribosylformylglycinamidine synthase